MKRKVVTGGGATALTEHYQNLRPGRAMHGHARPYHKFGAGGGSKSVYVDPLWWAGKPR